MLQSQQTDLFAETGSEIYPWRSHSLLTGKPRTSIQLEVPGSSQFTADPNLEWLIYQWSWTFGRTNRICILITGRSQSVGVYQRLSSSLILDSVFWTLETTCGLDSSCQNFLHVCIPPLVQACRFLALSDGQIWIIVFRCPCRWLLAISPPPPPECRYVLLVAQSCPCSLQPHGLQPARLLCPWNSPGKDTGVGCHSLL